MTKYAPCNSICPISEDESKGTHMLPRAATEQHKTCFDGLTLVFNPFTSTSQRQERKRGRCHMNHSSVRFPRWASCVAVVLLGVLTACNHSGDDNGAPGTASVSLTDAPACGFDAVNVTASKVRIHQSDSASDNAAGWTEITLNPPRKINLLDLNDPTQPNFALEHLGEAPLPAGHYTQLRLVLVPNKNPNPPLENSVVLSGTATEVPLDTPSAIQSGIKLVHQFDVPSGQRVDLLLDFDACKSIVQRGNGTYALKPVIQVIPFVLNGIEGFVAQSLLGSHVVVSAQANGEVIRRTVPNAVTGRFLLARLPAPANYDVVITADNHAAAVISGVPVNSATEIRPVSTQGAPIPVAPQALDPSATRTIDGSVALNPATDDVPVFIAAQQALVSGPTITTKTVVATPVATPQDGDFSYVLTLPVAAPALGAYTSTLPIVFTQQPSSVAGKYTVRASAEGYATQSAPVDISAANQSQNFALVP